MRRKNSDENRKKAEKLILKVKIAHNKNRRLKRKLKKLSEVDETNSDEDNGDAETDTMNTIMGSISPAPKKRALERLKINDNVTKLVRKALRLDRVGKRVNKKKEGVERVIKDFIFTDANSIVVPDTKKFKKDIDFHL